MIKKVLLYFLYLLAYIMLAILLFFEKKYLGAIIVFGIGTAVAYISLVKGLWK